MGRTSSVLTGGLRVWIEAEGRLNWSFVPRTSFYSSQSIFLTWRR